MREYKLPQQSKKPPAYGAAPPLAHRVVVRGLWGETTTMTTDSTKAKVKAFRKGEKSLQFDLLGPNLQKLLTEKVTLISSDIKAQL